MVEHGAVDTVEIAVPGNAHLEGDRISDNRAGCAGSSSNVERADGAVETRGPGSMKIGFFMGRERR